MALQIYLRGVLKDESLKYNQPPDAMQGIQSGFSKTSVAMLLVTQTSNLCLGFAPVLNVLDLLDFGRLGKSPGVSRSYVCERRVSDSVSIFAKTLQLKLSP